MQHEMNAAIIGTGMIGTVHARAIRMAGGQVWSVLASSPASTAAAAERMHAEPASSFDEVLADPEIDVVHICTPNASHAEQTIAALAAGKAVVCEKPVATTLEDAESILEAAKAAGRLVAVPYVYRFHPMVREIRARIEAGTSGTPRIAHGSYLQDWLADPRETNWRVDDAAGGPSRTFADIGVHWFDLLEFVTGQRVIAVSAATIRAHDERAGVPVTTEDAAAVLFSMDGGIRGSVLVSQISLGRKNRLLLSVDGDRESLEFNQELPDFLWVGAEGANRTLIRGEKSLSAAAQRYSVVPPGHPQGYQEAFAGFVRDVYASIGGSPVDGLPTILDGRRSIALTEAVLASARSGSWVEPAVTDES